MHPDPSAKSSRKILSSFLAIAFMCISLCSNAEEKNCTRVKIDQALAEIGHPEMDIRLMQRYRLEAVATFFAYWVNDSKTVEELQKLRGERLRRETALLPKIELLMADEFEKEVAALAFARLTGDLKDQAEDKTLTTLTSKLKGQLEIYQGSECADGEALRSLAASFEDYANYRLSPGSSEDGIPFASVPKISDILSGLAPGIANVLFFSELYEGTPHYFAAIFLQDRIKKIKLASVEETTEAISIARSSIIEMGELDDLEELSKLIWHPILEAIPEKVGLIRLKPTGPLYYAPFSALLDEQGIYAARRFDLEVTDRFSQFAGRFSNGYMVDMTGDSPLYFDRDPFGISESNSLIIAGPDFGENGNEDRQEASSKTPNVNSRSAEGLYFSPLPGALREGLAIQKSLPKGSATTLLSGSEATREAVILMVESNPKLIHIATHGYSIADLSSPSDERDPFLSSGLALAGSNLNKAESLLSSRQIIELDLSDTQVTFLSACNTAVGETLEGASVASLQQAFRLAGAKNVISTIWPISDSGATRFSKYFFANYSGNKPFSLIKVQREMMEDGEFSHPYFWAGYSTFSTNVIDDGQLYLERFQGLHKKKPEIEFTLSLFKGGTMIIRGLSTGEIKSFAELYRDFVPQIYSAELLLFELENNASFMVYRGEDAYYPVGIETFSDIEKHLSRLKSSNFESRDEVLLTMALANHLLPRSDLLDGGKVDRRYLPKVNEERAASLLQEAFDTSLSRGFEHRGYLQTAVATAIGLQGLIPEEDHDALLSKLGLEALRAGVADSSIGYSNRESDATDLRKQWFRYCLRSRIGGRDACETPQWAQVKYTANKAGRVFDAEVFDPSSQEFGTFLKRELGSREAPTRLLPKNPTAFSEADRVFQSTYGMGWSLKK